MLRALKTKLANVLRTQAEVATEPRFAAMFDALRGLGEQMATLADAHRERSEATRRVVEDDLRGLDNKHRERSEATRRIVEDGLRGLNNEHRERHEATRQLIVATSARLEDFIKLELGKLNVLVERNSRAIDIERCDMAETQRMVGVACARIENFIKLQREHSAALEQSVATLLPDRVRSVEMA